MRKALAVAVAMLLVASAAHAVNNVAGVTVFKHRSLTSVAIKAIVSGDDNGNAVLTLSQGWQGSPRDTGMVMHRRIGTNIFEARILWMTPGRVAEFRVEALDPDGNFITAVDTTSCAVVPQNPATGPGVYVSDLFGSAGNSGLSPSLAKKTIAQGLGVLAAQADSGRNGTVWVMRGHYHEKVALLFGTDGFIRTLAAYEDSVFICGANQLVEVGKRDATNSLSWNHIPCVGCGHADSMYVAYLPDGIGGGEAASSPGDSISSVTIGWGEWLHRKTSIKAILQDSTSTGELFLEYLNGEPSGWYWQNDSLYVKRSNGESPAGIRMHVGYLGGPLIDVYRSNWRISGLTVRFSGTPLVLETDGGPNPYDPNPNTFGVGILAGRNGITAVSNVVVDSCRFYGNNSAAVYFAYTSATVRSDGCTIANSSTDGLRIGSMEYSASKARVDEVAGSLRTTGARCNVYNCTVQEVANGIQTGPVAGDIDSTFGQNGEVANNTVTTVNDDALELDTTRGHNMLVTSNYVLRCGGGISVAPLYPGGPTFLIENTLLQFLGAGFKINNNSTGIVCAYNNTLASNRGPSSRAFEGVSGGQCENVTSYNNIYVSYPASNRGVIAGPDAGGGLASDLLNYDMVYKSAGVNAASWNAVTYATLALFQVTGRERNGIYADPNLWDYTTGDARPRQGSPALTAGRRITGVNTSMDGNRYTGVPHCGSSDCSTCTCH